MFMRAGVKQAFSLALAAMRAAYNPEGRRTTSHRGATTTRAWKLFVLTSRMLLRKTAAKGEEGKSEFLARVREYMAGRWVAL